MSRSFRKNIHGFGQLVPLAMAVIVSFALLFIGIYVAAEIQDSLTAQYPSAASRSKTQNRTIDTQNNISTNLDSSLDIVQIVIIISLLSAAIAAIFMFSRFGIS